ncbi:MAG: FGGY-family carbohydrate kinase [Firmicutes bacterium]|nr:FGGY-family carbohydrate kinase [Bacillota bacterium]
MQKTILTFDCGTQSIRAMLYDTKGELLAKAKRKYDEPYFSVKPHYAEQHADFYWENLCASAKELKEQNAGLWDSIIGVTVTCMRDVGICLDADMKPLRPAMLWLDVRKAPPPKLPLMGRALYSLVGMKEIVRMKSDDCKSSWIRHHEPEIWAKTAKFVQLSAYLNYKLTGVLSDSVASTVGHIPFDYKKGEWLKDNHWQASLFRVEYNKLYPLAKPGELLGEITETASKESGVLKGLPVVASGSDKSCETVGTGAIYEDCASISFGTTSTMQLTTKKYCEPVKFLPAYQAVYAGRFNPEFIIYRGYWLLTWFVEQFMKGEKEKLKDGSVEAKLNEKLKDVPPCCQGLYLMPYWNPGINLPEARGTMIGFTAAHTAVHVYRALIEGINFELKKGMEVLEKQAKTKVKRLFVSGGGAQSDEILQITADMFNLPVTRVQTVETSGLGAAVCAFSGLKVFPSLEDAIKNMVTETKTFTPNPEIHRIYKDFYENIYKTTYKKLKKVFKIIHEKH